MKSTLLSFFVFCSVCFSAEFSLYTPNTVNIEFRHYDNAVEFDLPMAGTSLIEDDLHRTFAISASLPLVSVDLWMNYVTPEYFDLNQITEQEFREQISQLETWTRRKDFLVYEVRVKSDGDEYAVLAINRGSDVLRWERGMDLSIAIFEKAPDGRWLRTTTPPNHWIYWIPVLNVDALMRLESGQPMLVDENNIVRYLSVSKANDLNRVSFLEQ
jgi:hypothetical protein